MPVPVLGVQRFNGRDLALRLLESDAADESDESDEAFDTAAEGWLHPEAARAYDALKADPSPAPVRG